jgi:chlorite dismutase
MTAYPLGTFPATFIGGVAGAWRIDSSAAVVGEPLPPADRLEVREGIAATSAGVWRLSGVAGHTRYVERQEKTRLDAVTPTLGRPEATMAALIPIRKSAAWWALPQDERRAIFEQRSHHIADSMAFLPRIARRLYHGRDLGQPFDFLTWFEFAEADTGAFDELVGRLRETEEWRYVDREVDIRLRRRAPPK